ncbi:MAG: hypothetical protein NZZ41_05160, partial [Candidatus Dojkabacteria bacterium]|nr:hypothetical protein [Candidatus Dojkabacteria bacterium]
HKKLLERLTKYNNIELIKIIDLMRKQDIFATILEIIYSIIIVKVLMIASDLGINEIVLDEKIENIRIRDRFSMELKKLGYTITII